MNRRYLVLCSLLGVVPILVLLWFVALARASFAEFEETDLDASGQAFEVNIDGHGRLWISDLSAGEIWQIDPDTGTYVIYRNLNSPSDARSDSDGNVWWADFNGNSLGRITLASGQVTTWTLPAADSPLGTAVDEGGHVWVTDFASQVFRFDPATTQSCTYVLPDDGIGDYLVANGGVIWLGDWWNSRIVRLNPATNLVTSWQLPESAFPEGIAVADSGTVWVADSQLGVLAQLEPAINQLTTYTLPVGIWPEMLAVADDLVWYTENFNHTVGLLDPAAASGVTSAVAKSDIAIAAACTTLGPGIGTAAVTSTGTATWTMADLSDEADSDGWSISSLPSGGSPWGIAVVNDTAYVVDQGRQKLVRIERDLLRVKVYVPLNLRR